MECLVWIVCLGCLFGLSVLIVCSSCLFGLSVRVVCSGCLLGLSVRVVCSGLRKKSHVPYAHFREYHFKFDSNFRSYFKQQGMYLSVSMCRPGLSCAKNGFGSKIGQLLLDLEPI